MTTLRFALRYARPHRTHLYWLVILTVIGSAYTVALPWPLKFAVDDVLAPGGSGSTVHLIYAATALVGVVATAQILKLVRRRVATDLGRRLTIDVGSELFRRLNLASLTDARRYKIGDVVARVTNDANAARELILSVGFDAFQQVVLLIPYTVILIALDPVSAVIIWVVAVLNVAVARAFTPPTGRLATEQAEAEAELMAHVDRSLDGLTDIWVNGALDREADLFAKTAARNFGTARRSEILQLKFGLSSSLLTTFGYGAVLLTGVLRVLDGALTVGELLVVLAYVSALQAPIAGLAYLLPEVAAIRAKVRRVTEFLAEIDERPLHEGVEVRSRARRLTGGRAASEVVYDTVSFSYDTGDSEPTLSNISFVAAPGTITAIVGPTGAGKTTLVSLLPRLIDPTNGTITIDGTNHTTINISHLRNNIAVVGQEPHLFNTTIADNIAYGRPNATSADIQTAAKAANAHHFITQLPNGYHTPIGDGATGLSGGQRQRLAIARALLKGAPILILDEPTSALDAETETDVMDAITNLTNNRTVLVIAHRLSTIRNADQILVIANGTIHEQGTHHQLLTNNDLYHTLHTTHYQQPTTTIDLDASDSKNEADAHV